MKSSGRRRRLCSSLTAGWSIRRCCPDGGRGSLPPGGGPGTAAPGGRKGPVQHGHGHRQARYAWLATTSARCRQVFFSCSCSSAGPEARCRGGRFIGSVGLAPGCGGSLALIWWTRRSWPRRRRRWNMPPPTPWLTRPFWRRGSAHVDPVAVSVEADPDPAEPPRVEVLGDAVRQLVFGSWTSAYRRPSDWPETVIPRQRFRGKGNKRSGRIMLARSMSPRWPLQLVAISATRRSLVAGACVSLFSLA